MVEVVERTERCIEVTRSLSEYEFIAVDSEGINLGKDGPLTLLQIGTTQGEVYLFDVLKNKEMFDQGGLKRILESDNVVKVIHSCRGDSAALFFQFNVHLRNVFDTQIAHHVIAEHRGRKLPRSLKLSDLCATYSDNAVAFEEKDSVKEKFVREVGNFWAVRPLTKEMIDYAAKDATALIPTVYQTQKQYIENHGLSARYRERVNEEVNCDLDENVKNKKQKRIDGAVNAVIDTFPIKYNATTTLKDITDEDDRHALEIIKHGQIGRDPLVEKLKTEFIKLKLQELDDQLREEGDRFVSKTKSYANLRSLKYHSDESVKRFAARVLKSIEENVLRIILYKHNTTSKLEHLSPYERDALKTLRPKSERDPDIHPVHLYLYWLVQEHDLDSTIAKFKEEYRNYRVTEGFYKWIKFCTKGPVPERMKAKAKAHLQRMDAVFGKGKIPTP